MKNSDLMYDRRIVERNVTKGLLSDADYEAYLAGLADCEQNAERVIIGEEESDVEAPPESEG